METLEKYISPLIETQFPAFIREDGPTFVAFVKAYFEWLEETGNPAYYTRLLPEIKDIDESLTEFLVHFKEKYLKGIPLTSHTDIRTLIKHSLDLYRSKGTERGVDLLFKLVFGVGTKVYFPGDDIFRLSDGQWVIPQYLEVSLSSNNIQFEGKQIYGISSGAIAFVERVIRRTVHGKFIDVLYISAIEGNFQTGEKINSSDQILDIDNCPYITGSLTAVSVSSTGIGSGFNIGDTVDLSSLLGLGAKARISDILNIIGIIVFEPLNYGYGYSSSSEVLISESVITVANLQPNSSSKQYWQLFETISQPRAALNYINANGEFAVGDTISTYYGNNLLKGYGICWNVATTNSTAGTLKVFVYSGDLDEDAIYNDANAVGANLAIANGYSNQTPTANIMAKSANITLEIINTGNYNLNEEVVAKNANGVITGTGVVLRVFNHVGVNCSLFVTNRHGFFGPNSIIEGLSSENSGNLAHVIADIALKDVTGTFVNNEFNYITGNVSQTNGVIQFISTGTGASLNVVTNTLLFVETANINSDLVRDYFFVGLEDAAYGFPANASANLTTANVADCLSYLSENCGKLVEITSINPGQEYNKAPYIRVYDQLTAGVNHLDIILHMEGLDGLFQIGEVVTQSASSARGIVKSANSSTLFLERLKVHESFVVTSNSTTILEGENSGAVANVTLSLADLDTDEVVGFNFNVKTSVQTGNGAISQLQIIDSGFGFEDGEEITISSNTNPDIVVSGIALLGKHGVGQGYYKQKGGFLSDQKKLYDGYYWQEYSYEIRSSIVLDKYKDMMKQVMHFAGSKMFGALENISIVDVETNINNTIVTVE